MHLTVEFDAAKGQIVRTIRVFANLDDAEETITIGTKLAVDLCVNREGHSSTSLLEVLELGLERCIVILLVRSVDSRI